MLDAVLDSSGFVTELRQAGLPVSLTEHLDAAEAVGHVPLEDREALKYALGATLVKSTRPLAGLRDRVRGLLLQPAPGGRRRRRPGIGRRRRRGRPAEPAAGRPGPRPGRAGGRRDGMSTEELAQLLYRALLLRRPRDGRGRRPVAVDRFAGMEPGRPVGGTYYLYRTLRHLDPDGLLEQMMARAAGTRRPPTLDERLFGRRVPKPGSRRSGEAVESEIRRRLVMDRGVEAMARTLRKPLPEDVDFMHATREEMAELQRAIHPLTRKLAVRLARKRRHGRRGPLDFRPPSATRCRPAACRSSRGSGIHARRSRRSS